MKKEYKVVWNIDIDVHENVNPLLSVYVIIQHYFNLSLYSNKIFDKNFKLKSSDTLFEISFVVNADTPENAAMKLKDILNKEQEHIATIFDVYDNETNKKLISYCVDECIYH